MREEFERQLKKIDGFLRLSMTYDRGSEMAKHPLMSKQLKLDIYFADPHSPWQRGSSENVNGLIGSTSQRHGTCQTSASCS